MTLVASAVKDRAPPLAARMLLGGRLDILDNGGGDTGLRSEKLCVIGRLCCCAVCPSGSLKHRKY